VRTTKDHFEQFVDYCKHFISEWGLTDWDVRFTHKMDKGNLATCTVEAESHIAIVNMSRSWARVDDELIRDTAMHEIAHILIGDVTCAAASRYISEQDLNRSLEIAANRIVSLVRRMEAGCQSGQGSPTTSS